MGIWTTYTSDNGTVIHECISPAPIVHSNGTGIFFTPVPVGGIPSGYSVGYSVTVNGVGMTLIPMSTGTPDTGSPPVNQNTTQTTTTTH
jgi:hypothetical protein